MTTLTENLHFGNFVLSMDDFGTLSVDNITVLQGSAMLYAGTVLGKVTASGKFAPIAFAASDGTQNAAAILMDKTDPTVADALGVGLMRHAEVYLSGLIWPTGATTNQKTAALAQLAPALIVAR